MMRDNRVCRQDVRIPRAVAIAHQRDVVAETEGPATGCVDTELRLYPCNNKPPDSHRLEGLMEICVLE